MSKVLGPDYRAYTDDIHLAAEASMRMACQLSPSTAGGSADSLSFTLRAPTNALRIRLGWLTYPTKRLSNKCILYIYIYIRYACSIVQSTHSLASQRADDTSQHLSPPIFPLVVLIEFVGEVVYKLKLLLVIVGGVLDMLIRDGAFACTAHRSQGIPSQMHQKAAAHTT